MLDNSNDELLDIEIKNSVDAIKNAESIYLYDLGAYQLVAQDII